MKPADNHKSLDEKIERKLTMLLLQAPAAIAILEGPDHIYTFLNPLYEKLFHRRRQDVLGKRLREVFPEVSDQGIFELFDQVFTTGEPFVANEFPAKFKNTHEETVGYYNFVIQPITSEAGTITDLMVHAYEVTKQVLAHKRIEESEKRLQLMADAMPLLISYVDRSLRYRFNNHAYEKWFGKNKADIFGRTMVEVLGEKAFESIRPKVEQALSGKPVRFEGELAYKDGGHRYVTADYLPHFGDEGAVLGFFVVVNDLTDRKHDEVKLRQSENRFRHLIESNIIGAIFWDLDGGIIDANDAFLELMGYTREELHAGINWKEMTPPQWRQKDQEATEEIQKLGYHRPFEKQYLHKNGTAVDVIIGSTAFQDSDNRQGVTFVLDISERKRVESVLKESESRYQSIYKSDQIGLVFAALDGTIVEANDAFLNMVGYTREEQETQALNIVSLTPAEHLYLDKDRAQELFETGEASPFEKQYFHRDGHRVDVWVGGISLLKGTPDLIVACVLNITSRKEAERALRQSEARFSAAVRALQGILWTNNAEGQMEGEQPGWTSLTGQTYEEYRGYGWAKVVHPEDAQPTIDAWNRALAEKRVFEFEHRLRIKNGEYGLFSIRAIPVKNADGTIREWVGVHTNITAQREAQAALAYRTALLEAHHEASVDGILLVDARGKILSYNQAFVQMWQIPPEIVVAHDDYRALDHAMTLVTNPDTFIERVRWLYDHPLSTTIDEITMRDGRVFERHGYPVLGSDGTFYAWSWTFRDITRQKQFAEQLEKLVNERTTELRQSNNDLQQFAHVASHDLKEPVRKVKTFVNRLELEFGGSLSEKGQLYLSKIQNATDRMVAMIEGVLNYSTVSASAQRSEEVNLNALIHQIETDLEVIIHETNTRVVFNNLPTIEGAAVLLYQLFYNLINNSIKFARPGVPPEVVVTGDVISRSGVEWAVLVVRDNGIGFQQEHADIIFDTFTRLNSKDKYEGTGLGLALVRKIVERHAGTIEAYGSHGDGARFVINLPLRQKREQI